MLSHRYLEYAQEAGHFQITPAIYPESITVPASLALSELVFVSTISCAFTFAAPHALAPATQAFQARKRESCLRRNRTVWRDRSRLRQLSAEGSPSASGGVRGRSPEELFKLWPQTNLKSVPRGMQIAASASFSAEGWWRDPRGWSPEEFFKILPQTNLTSVPRDVDHDFGSFRLLVYCHSHWQSPRGRSPEETVPTFKLFPQTR